MSIIGLLVAVVIVCLVIWVVQRLTAAFDVGEPLRTVILVAVVLILLVWFLGEVGLTPQRLWR